MTTDQIEVAANRGDIATGDMNLKQILRRAVVPMFLEGVGRVGWRRVNYTFNTVIGTAAYTLPTDFLEAYGVYLPSNFDHTLKFIGEDPDRVARAEANATNAPPTGYYILNAAGTAAWKQLKFDAPCDAVYAMRLSYYRFGYFADDSTSVDMAFTIPEQYHWALVDGLRAEIFLDRFGQGDPRFVASDQKFQKWIGTAAGRRELAARNHANFVK